MDWTPGYGSGFILCQCVLRQEVAWQRCYSIFIVSGTGAALSEPVKGDISVPCQKLHSIPHCINADENIFCSTGLDFQSIPCMHVSESACRSQNQLEGFNYDAFL